MLRLFRAHRLGLATMSHTAFLHRKSTGSCPGATSPVAKGRAKFPSGKIQRNLLICLDSGERIQRNPTLFWGRRGQKPRWSKKAQIDRASGPRLSERRPQSRYVSPSDFPAMTGRGLPSSSMATKVKVASVTFSRSCVSRRRAHASTWTFIEVRPTPSIAV